MPLQDLVIRSQLIPPRQRRGVLRRPRLEAALAGVLDYPITVVHAATGYGKSTALAALAGMLHALYSPNVSPGIANLASTVNLLLMVLIGGVGTLSGAPIGAALVRLLSFYLDKWFGEASGFLIGLVYVGIVLFLPYGIVGTAKLKGFQWRAGW